MKNPFSKRPALSLDFSLLAVPGGAAETGNGCSPRAGGGAKPSPLPFALDNMPLFLLRQADKTPGGDPLFLASCGKFSTCLGENQAWELQNALRECNSNGGRFVWLDEPRLAVNMRHDVTVSASPFSRDVTISFPGGTHVSSWPRRAQALAIAARFRQIKETMKEEARGKAKEEARALKPRRPSSLLRKMICPKMWPD